MTLAASTLSAPSVQRLLTPREVARQLNMSRRSLDRLVAKGEFPEPIRYSPRLVRWSQEQVDEHLSSKTPVHV